MSQSSPFPPGAVQWSGENPGMYLKESADGPFTSLASFYRVDTSPHGSGVGVVLLEAPGTPASSPEALNVCVSDNEALSRYLVEHYISTFGSFKGQPGLQGLEYRALTAHSTQNDMPKSYTEHLGAEGVAISLTWAGLGDPFMVDMPAEQGPTGIYRMFSLFVDCNDARATINGRALKGRSFPRDFAGRQSTTAFLAFSETWILPG